MYNNLKDKKILYIEDDEVVLKNISKLLQNYFAHIYTAYDGEEGFRKFLEHKVDLLVVDIELPKLNGINLIKKIRKHNSTIPIVVISAYTKTDYLLESVELKLDKYIVKPFTSRKLHELLGKLDESFTQNNIFNLREDVVVDKVKGTVTSQGKEYTLTMKELEFLELLAKKGNVTYGDIDRIWKEQPPTSYAIRSFIKILRKKLPPKFLKNKQNLGYYIEQ
ncbi:MAG: DNA-binding response regulator [Sulfurospirillum sp.]|nr:MAG: DNA-binding response regulator [Sulfurospirillum sp.]